MPKRKRPSQADVGPATTNSMNVRDFVLEGVPQVHEDLVKHVLANGAKLLKVQVKQFPYGIGIVASERIRKNEEIVSIPTPLLVNVHDITIPNSSPRDYPTTVHSTMAAYLASTTNNGGTPFTAILPTSESFRSSLPLFWPDDVLINSHPWIIDFATKQRKKLAGDYQHALKVHAGLMKSVSKEDYEWAWAVVNTRTIYYKPKGWEKAPAEDCMTMCPFVDYFNHDAKGDETCEVRFGPNDLSVTTTKSYEPGEEIYVTYGQYNNNHLLVEYGFTLPINRSDNINLDPFLLPKLPTPQHATLLKDLSFHGYAFQTPFHLEKIYSGSEIYALDANPSSSTEMGSEYYFDDSSGPCYRTITALRLAVIEKSDLPGNVGAGAGKGGRKGGKRWRDFVKLVEGEMEEDNYVELYGDDEVKVQKLAEEVLEAFKASMEDKLRNLRNLKKKDADEWYKSSVDGAIRRWEEMGAIYTSWKEKNNGQ